MEQSKEETGGWLKEKAKGFFSDHDQQVGAGEIVRWCSEEVLGTILFVVAEAPNQSGTRIGFSFGLWIPCHGDLPLAWPISTRNRY